MSYFSKDNAEVRELIHKCMDELDESVRLDYLVNVLSAQHNQTRTIKETFEFELKAKEDFEKDMEERNARSIT